MNRITRNVAKSAESMAAEKAADSWNETKLLFSGSEPTTELDTNRMSKLGDLTTISDVGMENRGTLTATEKVVVHEILEFPENVVDEEYLCYTGMKLQFILFRSYPNSVDAKGNDDLIFAIRSFAAHARFSVRHAQSIAICLTHSDQRVRDTARISLERLERPVMLLREMGRRLGFFGGMSGFGQVNLYRARFTKTVTARIEWFDRDIVVLRFLHPRDEYGMVEREFFAEDLPRGAEVGDHVWLCIEVNVEGNAIGYGVLKTPVRKALPPGCRLNWPVLPADLDDEVGSEEYERVLASEVREALRRAEQET